MSGGLPHSEICGSKPIPGSPQLNAGYHVLHRLLLPRHPPNALFALDLIQKEQGSGVNPNSFLPVPPREGQPNCSNHSEQRVKSCILSHVSIYPKDRLKRLVY